MVRLYIIIMFSFNVYIFVAEHGMGIPSRALESLQGYLKWREGYGWGPGTVVQIAYNDTMFITRVTRVQLPLVFVTWGLVEISMNVEKVLPLSMKEIETLPETVQGVNKIKPPICEPHWLDFV